VQVVVDDVQVREATCGCGSGVQRLVCVCVCAVLFLGVWLERIYVFERAKGTWLLRGSPRCVVCSVCR
jgi:hypothetical protein